MKNTYTLFILLSIVIFSRILIIDNYIYCDADEATVGIMAKHISEGKEIPFYFYGQAYCGGTVIEALTTAFLFKLFSISNIIFKLNAILYYSIFCYLVFYIFQKYYNSYYGFIIYLIMLISPESIKISLSNRGYQPLNIIALVMIILFFKLIKHYKNNNEINIKLISLLSLNIGFSLWIFEHSLPVILNIIIFSVLLFKLKKLIKCFKYILLFFLIGYSPSITFNFLNNFANWKSLVSYKPLNNSINFKSIFSVIFPTSFTNNYIDDYRIIETGIPILSKIMAFLFIFALFYLILYYFKKIYFSYKTNNKLKINTLFSIFLINTVLIFNILYLFNRSLFSTPRYFWIIFPFFYFTIIQSIFIFIKKRPVFIILSCLFFLLFSLHSYFNFWNKKNSQEIGSCLNSVGKPEKVNGASLNKILYLLKKNKVRFVYSNYFMSWPITFHSYETIIALSVDLPGCRYKKYINLLKKNKPQAIILFSDDPINNNLKNNFKRKIKIDNFFVYLL